MKQLIHLVLGLALIGGAALQADAALVLHHDFSLTTDPAVPTDGQSAGGGFNAANVADMSGNDSTGQANGNITYAVGTLPGGLSGAPNYNGFGVNVPSGNDHWVRYGPHPGNSPDSPQLGFQSDFSALARVYLTSNGQIMGSTNMGEDGWYMGTVDDNGSPLLRVGVGGEEITASVAFDTWYDIGLTFSGVSGDGNPDTFKAFLNGSLVGSVTTPITFDLGAGSPGDEILFVWGSGPHGSSGMGGYFEQIRLWNETLSDEAMKSMMIPEPASLALMAMGLALLNGRRRRSASRR